jgi:hypothetical protein
MAIYFIYTHICIISSVCVCVGVGYAREVGRERTGDDGVYSPDDDDNKSIFIIFSRVGQCRWWRRRVYSSKSGGRETR